MDARFEYIATSPLTGAQRQRALDAGACDGGSPRASYSTAGPDRRSARPPMDYPWTTYGPPDPPPRDRETARPLDYPATRPPDPSDDHRPHSNHPQTRVYYPGDVLTREGSDARLILFLEGGSLSGVRLRKRPLPTPVQLEVEGGEGLDATVEDSRMYGVVLGLAEAMEGNER